MNTALEARPVSSVRPVHRSWRCCCLASVLDLRNSALPFTCVHEPVYNVAFVVLLPSAVRRYDRSRADPEPTAGCGCGSDSPSPHPHLGLLRSGRRALGSVSSFGFAIGSDPVRHTVYPLLPLRCLIGTTTHAALALQVSLRETNSLQVLGSEAGALQLICGETGQLELLQRKTVLCKLRLGGEVGHLEVSLGIAALEGGQRVSSLFHLLAAIASVLHILQRKCCKQHVFYKSDQDLVRSSVGQKVHHGRKYESVRNQCAPGSFPAPLRLSSLSSSSENPPARSSCSGKPAARNSPRLGGWPVLLSAPVLPPVPFRALQVYLRTQLMHSSRSAMHLTRT